MTAGGVKAAVDRRQTLGEEIANSISHGAGLLSAIAGTPFLIWGAARQGDALNLVGASIFAASMVLLYFTSTLYHALPHTRKVKQLFQLLDHGAIYLLIAGTYTPFMLGVLRGPWGWTLLALIWTMALAGIVLKAAVGLRFPRVSIAFYLVMGWLALVAIEPLWQRMPGWGLFWLIAGGLSYTLGVAFYATDWRLRYGHFVWHLFVAAGTACHFIAVLNYAVQPVR